MKGFAVLEPIASADDRFTLVTICGLMKGKGIDLVLHALKILDAREIPYRYIIGGDGPKRNHLDLRWMHQDCGTKPNSRVLRPVKISGVDCGWEMLSLRLRGSIFRSLE
jgi:glycosyltransferase involved in cell wall biosynthesis